MTEQLRNIVVVGGSIAAVTAAQSLRLEGFEGTLTMLAAERHAPYSRVPLSKGILAGTESIATATLSMAGIEVELHLNESATGLDLHKKVVRTDSGGTYPYDGLVIASGARARRLLRDGEREYVVRTLDDVMELEGQLRSPKSVSIIGGGFLGMEVASVLTEHGHQVTVFDLERPLVGRTGEWLAARAAEAGAKHGCQFVADPKGFSLRGVGGAVTVESPTFGTFESDIAITAVGDIPNIEWLSGTDLEDPLGVRVDEYCRASENIIAVGDVALRANGSKLQRTPHWTNAVEQGRAGAKALLAKAEAPYKQDHYFWTDQFGLEIKMFGKPPFSGRPRDVVVERTQGQILEFNEGFAAIDYRGPIVKLKRLYAATRQSPV